ncbi:MAG TPA: XRE family transcriptional regulator [Gammaproteobacteria bacterium]|nr:XRE family transcriptional regulator [Gammaproteobacteria bacterium]
MHTENALQQQLAELIAQIAETGRARGMTQVQIARAAGLADETLSRAKRNPNIGLMHFARLAAVVGLKPTLLPDDPVIEKIHRGGLFEP